MSLLQKIWNYVSNPCIATLSEKINRTVLVKAMGMDFNAHDILNITKNKTLYFKWHLLHNINMQLQVTSLQKIKLDKKW